MTNQEAIEHLKAGRIDPEITAMCIAALAAQDSVKHADFTPLTPPQVCPRCGVELEPNGVYPHVCHDSACLCCKCAPEPVYKYCNQCGAEFTRAQDKPTTCAKCAGAMK